MTTPKQVRGSLDERLQAHPQLRAHFERLLDELEQRASTRGTLDEVEEAIIPLVRQVGQEVLRDCAQTMAAQTPAPAGRNVRRHVKKKSGG